MELTAATSAVYFGQAYRQMLDVAERLGDDLVNERPHGEQTNSVAALIAHCSGVIEFWMGHVALGRPNNRNRDAEFDVTATVIELREIAADALATAESYAERLDAGEGIDEGGRQFLPDGDESDAAVVLHVLEELFQHLGHMELTADALLTRG